MLQDDVGLCPYCQAQLEPGYLGFTSGLLWSRERLNWLQSLFFVAALSLGQLVIGSLGTTPWFRYRAAHRCTVCGALVVATDR